MNTGNNKHRQMKNENRLHHVPEYCLLLTKLFRIVDLRMLINTKLQNTIYFSTQARIIE